MPQVSVTINGRSYKMACDEGEENRLMGLAEEFNGYVSNLKGSFGEIGDQRLTVMAGIMVIDEIRELRKQLDTLKDRLETIRQESQAESDGFKEAERKLAAGLDETAARIEEISRDINATLKENGA